MTEMLGKRVTRLIGNFLVQDRMLTFRDIVDLYSKQPEINSQEKAMENARGRVRQLGTPRRGSFPKFQIDESTAIRIGFFNTVVEGVPQRIWFNAEIHKTQEAALAAYNLAHGIKQSTQVSQVSPTATALDISTLPADGVLTQEVAGEVRLLQPIVEAKILEPAKVGMIRAIGSEPTLVLAGILTELHSLTKYGAFTLLGNVMKFPSLSLESILDGVESTPSQPTSSEYSLNMVTSCINRLFALSGVVKSKVFTQRQADVTRYRIYNRDVEFVQAAVGQLANHFKKTRHTSVDYFTNATLNINERDAFVNRINLFRVLVSLREQDGESFAISPTQLSSTLNIGDGALLTNHIYDLSADNILSYAQKTHMYGRGIGLESLSESEQPIVQALEHLEQKHRGRTQFSYIEIAEQYKADGNEFNAGGMRGHIRRMAERSKLVKQVTRSEIRLTNEQFRNLKELVDIIDNIISPKASFISKGKEYWQEFLTTPSAAYTLLQKAMEKSPHGAGKRLRQAQEATASTKEIIPETATAAAVTTATPQAQPEQADESVDTSNSVSVKESLPRDEIVDLLHRITMQSEDEELFDELATFFEEPQAFGRVSGKSPTYVFEYVSPTGQQMQVKWVRWVQRGNELNGDAHITFFLRSASRGLIQIITFYPPTTDDLEIETPAKQLNPRDYRTLNSTLNNFVSGY